MRSTTGWALGTLVVLAACDHITAEPVCGCSPVVPPSTVVTGAVTTANDQPAAGARVVVEQLENAACDLAASGKISQILQADQTGAFRFQMLRISAQAWCFRISAEPANLADGRPSAQQLVPMRATPAGTALAPDSVRVSLRLQQ